MNTSTFQSPDLAMEMARQRARLAQKRHHEYLDDGTKVDRMSRTQRLFAALGRSLRRSGTTLRTRKSHQSLSHLSS